MRALMQPLSGAAGLEDLRRHLGQREGPVALTGCLDSQKTHLVSFLSGEENSVLYLAEDDQKAREVWEEYRLYDRDALFWPEKDPVFYSADLAGNMLTRERMKVIKALCERKNVTVISGAGGALEYLLPFRVLKNTVFTIKNDSAVNVDELADRLSSMGYERTARVEMTGQFAVRGGIIDIYPLTEEIPWRIELWGDEVDSIRSFDPESQRSVENLREITIYPATEEIGSAEPDWFRKLSDNFFDYMPEGFLLYLDEPNRILEAAKEKSGGYRDIIRRRVEKGRISGAAERPMLDEVTLQDACVRHRCILMSLLNVKASGWEITDQLPLNVRSVSSYHNQFPMLVKDMKNWQKQKYMVVLLTASGTRGGRLARELQEEGLNAFYTEDRDREIRPGEIMLIRGGLRCGFEYPLQKFVLLSETDIFGKTEKKRRKRLYSGEKIKSFDELHPGDYVVHESHGLGIYRGIEKVEVDHTVKDYIKIEYAGGSNLFVQAGALEVLQKYAGGESKQPKLNRLGGQTWEKTKSKVRSAVADIADDLVKLYAARQDAPGFQYGPDTVWQKEFEEMFPFEETEDQLNAIADTKKDMESSHIMDRLICGDVGYGKTEIAIRAAFKAVQENKQVVLLTPTTILAQQHYNTFLQRMKDYPVRIDLLCRFRTPAQQKKTLADLKKGMVDIVIGTHRVLSKDVAFKDLGLLIIDEEQRFGVTNKEKIKQLRTDVDVLTLTATPIPRTLHMSLVGIRDMSVLEEPPMDRLPIQTYVMEYDEELVREAIKREIARGGQVYYVYNRINTIADVTARIAKLMPEAAVAFAHGRMNESELEQIMFRFINREIDVLVSTTIIETGIDIPNVNTLIVHDADRMGLSQLYQLRGRVGRSNCTAYAFLMYRRDKVLREVAEKRLAAIREFTALGSGIRVAMRDLEIRGAGNLLGAEQHGHMAAVGYDLYCKLLAEAVAEAKGISPKPVFGTSVDLQIDAFIPSSYVPTETEKLDIYKRIAAIETDEEAEDMREELEDRFGDLPDSVQNLLTAAAVRFTAHRLYIEEIRQNGAEIRINLWKEAQIEAQNIPQLLNECGHQLRIRMETVPYFIYRPHAQKGRKQTIADQTLEFLHIMERYLLPEDNTADTDDPDVKKV